MKAQMNRRDFFKGTAWMGMAALAAGCRLNRLGFGEGGSMQNFAFRKLGRIRVGFVGKAIKNTFLAFAFAMISRSLPLLSGFAPPSRTAIAISRPILVNTAPRCASALPFFA